MYTLPDSFDTKILLDERLIMICFNSSQVYFHFDSHLMITIDGEFIVEKDFKIEKYHPYLLKSDCGLLELIETTITDCYTDVARKDLRIKFSNSMIVTLLATENYESYLITKGDLEIRV